MLWVPLRQTLTGLVLVTTGFSASEGVGTTEHIGRRGSRGSLRARSLSLFLAGRGVKTSASHLSRYFLLWLVLHRTYHNGTEVIRRDSAAKTTLLAKLNVAAAHAVTGCTSTMTITVVTNVSSK